MKKIVTYIMVFLICFLSGCTSENKIDTKELDAEILTITIPKSYFDYSGTTAEEAVASYNELGNEYCTDVELNGETMLLKVTATQREKLIQRNNTYIEELLEDFRKSNEKYVFVSDEEYKNAIFYFDENLSVNAHAKAILGVTAGYGLNYILLNETTEWSVHLEIYNCHTGNLVVETNIPQDNISYGVKEWEESYE